jgi:hypothetical protein
MRTSLALTLAAVLALGATGCANCPLRSVLHRGADCGPTAPTTLPLVGGMTSYTPGCGIEEACPTCGIGGMGGVGGVQPYVYEGGYPVDGSIVLPTPGQ